MDRSKLFTAYNLAKAHARRSEAFDPKTVDRALGLLMSKQRESEYTTTTEACSCPDAWYRRHVCKHQVALMIEKKMGMLNGN